MKYEFRATIEVPDGTPEDDVECFLEFELGLRCELSGKNALANSDIASLNVTNLWVSAS